MSKKNRTELATRVEVKPLAEQLQGVHPIHGAFIRTFEEVGGEERLREWADANYGDFVKIFVRIAPRPPADTQEGTIKISIHPSLKRSPLDG